MIQKIKKALIALVTLATLAAPTLAPAVVRAANQVESGLCQGTNLNVDPGQPCTIDQTQGGSTSGRINDIITTVVNILSIVVGVVAVIMIIVGGLKYILSGGDSSNVTSAKNTILFAIVGLVIVALAQFIVRFVLDKVT